jgi:hypothetical protein
MNCVDSNKFRTSCEGRGAGVELDAAADFLVAVVVVVDDDAAAADTGDDPVSLLLVLCNANKSEQNTPSNKHCHQCNYLGNATLFCKGICRGCLAFVR